MAATLLPSRNKRQDGTPMKCVIKIALVISGFVTTDAAAGQIDITMAGFSSDQGMARIVLVEGIEEYTGEVPDGTYAIIAHHDRNANNELDRPVFELPLEPYGYSNGAWTSLGLPPFEDVAFEVGDGIARQLIPMRTNGFISFVRIIVASVFATGTLIAFVALLRRRATRLA
jgi:uncharacterized protein (DUF2141 family)